MPRLVEHEAVRKLMVQLSYRSMNIYNLQLAAVTVVDCVVEHFVDISEMILR